MYYVGKLQDSDTSAKKKKSEERDRVAKSLETTHPNLKILRLRSSSKKAKL